LDNKVFVNLDARSKHENEISCINVLEMRPEFRKILFAIPKSLF